MESGSLKPVDKQTLKSYIEKFINIKLRRMNILYGLQSEGLFHESRRRNP